MTNVNMDLAIKSNLNTEDLVLISYVERIVGELNCKEINYKQIINYRQINKTEYQIQS